MSSNSEMQSDFDQGNTFDIQRPHFDANFTFEAIADGIDAVLTAIVALTKCSKTWFLCKGTPRQIVKAASGDSSTSAKKLLNIFQNFHQVATELFISDFKERQDWPAQEPGFVTLFSPSSVHHAGMPKLQENLKGDKSEFKLICQFALNAISDDECIKKIDNGTGFGQHIWAKQQIALVMKPIVLKIHHANLEALSRQLQSQLRISHESLVQFHKAYESTANYESQDPIVLGPPQRINLLQSPCLFMKYPLAKDALINGNEIAAEKILNDLSRNVGRIFGYEKATQGTLKTRRLVIHHPACKQILGIAEFVGRFQDCTDFTIEELLKISVRSAEGGAPWCCASKWRSTFACLALLENKLDSNPELTTMMFLTDQFASLAKLSGETSLYENTGLYLKDLDGKFGKLLAILRDTGGLSGLDCVVDDDFSHWYNPSEDKAIAFEEQDFKDAPSEFEVDAGSAKRLKLVTEAGELAEADANEALWKFLQSLAKPLNE
jgi:hypothetical protein